MATGGSSRVVCKLLWAQPGFRHFFTAMFVSLFGSGMNFIGGRYILSAAHSTVVVSQHSTEPHFLCPGMFATFQDCYQKRKNFLGTPAGKFFAGRVARF